MDISRHTALITGANRGIGLALTRALLAAGVRKLYAACRNPATMPDLGDERVEVLTLDITDPAQAEAAARRAGDVSLLINNAGIASAGPFTQTPRADLRQDMATNYEGTLNVIEAFLPALKANTGAGQPAAMVNVTSIGAFANLPLLGGYCASKAALLSMSQGLRIELADAPIEVFTINPGPIETDMTAGADFQTTPSAVAAQNTIDALQRGEYDIFPDPASQEMIAVWKQDYRELEKLFGNMTRELQEAA